jgi:hypothetical protein
MHPTNRFLLVASALASACAGPRPEVSGVAEVRPSATEEPATRDGGPVVVVAPESPEPAVKTLVIERPANVACALSTETWRGSLQLRDGGATFATVHAGKGTLHLPVEGGAAVIDLTGGLELTAVVSAPSVHLARPMALGDFAVPLAETALELAAPHEAGRMNVGLDVSDLFDAPLALRQAVPCSALAPAQASYDASAFVRQPTSDLVGLAPFTSIRSAPNGPVVARLGKAPYARIGATSGASRHIVLEGRGYVAAGWVPSAAVNFSSLGMRGGVGRLGRRMRGYPRPSTCGEPLRVWAQIDGERAVIGVLPKGVGYVASHKETRENTVGFVSVELTTSWLDVDDRAVLLLDSLDVARCQAQSKK